MRQVRDFPISRQFLNGILSYKPILVAHRACMIHAASISNKLTAFFYQIFYILQMNKIKFIQLKFSRPHIDIYNIN